MLPVIGITTYGRDRANRYTLPAEYVTAVRRAGGLPVLIAPGADTVEPYLELVDGLILTGGGDIDPHHYGGTRHETIYNVDAERDQLELALARAVVQRGLPTFGVCRGAQIINVALGGTLIEHLPAAVGDSVLHRKPPREPTPHPVQVQPGSRLAAIVGAAELHPQSWHHQAIRSAATGLKVVAHAPDGTIEAVEMPEHPWLIAVQWHPELTAHEDETQQRLFDALIVAAMKS
ncbi:MAG: gamma-glutamyl-gamma-aminobutyrate hydrolase family protein [Nevskiales bacterium]